MTQDRALEIQAKLQASPDRFEELAAKHSQDPGSASKGGSLGSFGRGAMVKPFEDAVFNMEIGRTRQSPGSKDAPIQPGEHERLDIATLIKGYTLDGAYQLHMEDSVGSITVGKNADFVLLDQNLFDVDKYEIHKVKVLQTILGGKAVYVQSK